MNIAILHATTYRYDRPVPFGLQQLRLTPSDGPGQTVTGWQVALDGGKVEAVYDDHHGNRVMLASITAETERVAISCSGMVETEDLAGITGPHGGLTPLWLYRRHTGLTRPGAGVRRLLRTLGAGHDGEISRMHALSALIRDEIAYQPGETRADTTAEDALATRAGVCQDHAHVFIAAARALDLPARYISGYLATGADTVSEAAHGWAEVHVDGLGWVGFDISNGICPDSRYVRVAVGLDYDECAPVAGLRYGDGHETLEVSLMVQQQ